MVNAKDNLVRPLAKPMPVRGQETQLTTLRTWLNTAGVRQSLGNRINVQATQYNDGKGYNRRNVRGAITF